MFIVFSGEFHGVLVERFLLNVYSLELLNLGNLYFSIKAKVAETENYSGAKVVFLGYLPKGLFLFLPWGFPVCHGKTQRYQFLQSIFVPATSPSSLWHPRRG